jgi:fumarate reductase subunit D
MSKFNFQFDKSKNLMGLSLPAGITCIAYIVLLILILLPIQLRVHNRETQRYETIAYSFSERLLMVLLLSLPFALTVFSINCMVTNGAACNIWAYIVAGMISIYVLIVVVSVLLYG